MKIGKSVKGKHWASSDVFNQVFKPVSNIVCANAWSLSYDIVFDVVRSEINFGVSKI